jgi:pimeloyl-ACP methyl ester carboxylesterase
MRNKFYISSFLILIFLLSGCHKDDPKVERQLVSADSYLLFKKEILKQLIVQLGLDVDVSQIKYDVEVFKVRYRTKFKDREIEASGLVALPVGASGSVSMISFQHGTIAADSDAPSTSPLNDQTTLLYATLASPGLIAVIPDYIGFGASADIVHPYYVEKATADAVIDNLKAARDLANDKGLSFNKNLFLAGYSQGGYATMAAHKAIETNGLNGFNLKASFPAAGGYDVKGMQEYFFGQQTYEQPYYLAYVALSYQNYYAWSAQSLSDFFKEPFASKIPSLFNGTNGATQINNELTTTVGDFITADALSNIDSDSKYSALVSAFNENSLLDWTPKIRMVMYHGNADVTVPYQNSVDTYNTFISNGASSDVVSFVTLEGGTHSTGVFPYLEDFINKMIALN